MLWGEGYTDGEMPPPPRDLGRGSELPDLGRYLIREVASPGMGRDLVRGRDSPRLGERSDHAEGAPPAF